MGRAVVRRHAVVLTALLAAPLAACSDATPGALDSNAIDHAVASAVWRDPWVAPTVAMAPGPGLGTNGLVTRVVGGRTTSYAVPVEAAATELLAAARPEDGDVGVLVAPMVRGARELIAGLHRDPQFGLTVMLGLGGILAEVTRLAFPPMLVEITCTAVA